LLSLFLGIFFEAIVYGIVSQSVHWWYIERLLIFKIDFALLFASKWMELESIILSEVSQVQKPKKASCFL
jgi:hypothetical protein